MVSKRALSHVRWVFTPLLLEGPIEQLTKNFTGFVAKFDFDAKSQNLGSGIQWLTDANTLEKATLRQNPGLS
jgi:hypothetical protein